MSRPERVAQFLKREISLILRNKVNDPRIGFVSLTDVEITPDLKYAKIFVSILGDEKSKKSSMLGLKSATSFVRGELGKILELREVPQLHFERDNSLERGSQIISLLNKLKHE